MFTFFHRTKPGRKIIHQRAASWKPRLEVLEDRTVPSTTFDAASDFSATSNPNQVWSYGYSLSLGSTFNLLTASGRTSDGVLDSWERPVAPYHPSVFFNPAPNTVTSGTVILGGRQLALHPGPSGEYSIVRFTSAIAGPIVIDTGFFGVDTCGVTTDVHVLHNGVSLFDGTVNAFDPSTGPSFTRTLSVLANDTIDFAVGFGRDSNFFCDTTGLRATIATAPDIAPTSLTWNTTQSGVDFAYKVTGAPLPKDTTAMLYWASGTTTDTILEPATTPIPIPQTTPPDQIKTVHLAPADFPGGPAPGAKYLLAVVDPDNLVAESDETNNVVALALPDLIGASFHYRVLEDQHPDPTLRLDGPLPFNAHFDISAEVRNQGLGAADTFKVVFFASPDLVIDSGDVRLASVTVIGLAPGATQAVSFANLSLPQTLPWTGKIALGMIIDPIGELPQIEDRGNDSNQAVTVDHANVQLYDPIPAVTEITGFRTQQAARRYLLLQGFHPVLPFTGSGWSRWLSPFSSFVSRFDGKVRSGLAYRQNAFIEPPDQTHNTYWILLQGTSTVAEPNPETAIFYDFQSPGWFAYVFDWHLRF
jgi:hypothetical protein